MKKVVLAIALVAVLIGSTLGGLAYAGSSKAPITNKLVGLGVLGNQTFNIDETNFYREFHNTTFVYVNPSSKYDITIEEVSIYMVDGTQIYNCSIPKVLQPHQSSFTRLDAALFPLVIPEYGGYHVEVIWSCDGKGLPLMGTANTVKRTYLQGDTVESMVAVSRTATQMESLRETP